MEIKKGSKIGVWKVSGRLGSGGQGDVWKVRHSTEKHCPPRALKVSSSDKGTSARFAKELQLLQDFPHKHIVRVFDSGTYLEHPYYVMGLATVSLEKLADPQPTPGIKVLQQSPLLVLRLFREVCEAVAHLHTKGVLHRDLKPSNVLIMVEPREPVHALLGDLGISTEAKDQGKITRTQEIVGTPGYRAPEQNMGLPASAASDVYGLGRLLEFVLCCAHPNTMSPRPTPKKGEFSRTLCDAYDEVLAKACQSLPENRYEDASQFLEALPKPKIFPAEPKWRKEPDPLAIVLSDNSARILGEAIGLSAPGESVSIYSLREKLTRVSGQSADHRNPVPHEEG